MEKETKKCRHISTKILAALFLLCIILNVIAWQSTAFCDWYTKNIFPVWTNTYGRLTSLFPFSVGEVLIIIGIVGIPLSLIAMLILIIVRKKKRMKTAKIFILTYLWILCFVLVTETLNCFILYHCSTFASLNNISEETHSERDLEALAKYLVTNTNSLAVQVQRDEDGHFVLTADLNKTARSAVKNLGDEFYQLDGYYVKPKKVANSFFMSQQYLMGIYFPFSMEANYNQQMYSMNLPDTVCHELVHTRGIIQEDEASFIAFVACAKSDNIEYQYSGYINALQYVLGKVRENCDDETIDEIYAMIHNSVAIDFNANSEYWQSVQESDEGLISSETVAEVADKAMETSLKLNGVEDGKQSYGRMVDLLLNYIDYDEYKEVN